MLILCGFVAAVILGPGDRWCASRGTDNILFTNSTTISKFNVNPCDTWEIGESTCKENVPSPNVYSGARAPSWCWTLGVSHKRGQKKKINWIIIVVVGGLVDV